MNLGPAEVKKYFSEFEKIKPNKISDSEWVLFVPAYFLNQETIAIAQNAGFSIGAQNVHWEDQGAFTAELSGKVLKEIGIHWCLIAHSERRQFFGETNESAFKRIKKASQLGLSTVFCVGETLAERDADKTKFVLETQIRSLTQALKGTEFKNISVAYEPVWAIGTGKTATVIQAVEAHQWIREFLKNDLGFDKSNAISILYGGSVTPENAKELLVQPEIDGVLVGGASLKPESFSKILASL